MQVNFALYAGSRSPSEPPHRSVFPFRFDLLDEESISAAAEMIRDGGKVDLAIIATGMLHDGRDQMPEKSFGALNSDAMTASFRINAVGPALIFKHMVKALPRERRSVIAALSARVGSIGDNRLGGWHSYRASKAALNMIIANLAVELRRTHPLAIAIGLHPGTVDTHLSEPFQKGVAAGSLFAPAKSARHIVDVLSSADDTVSGRVLAWDGSVIEN